MTEQEAAGCLLRIKFAPLYVLGLVWAPTHTHCTSPCAQMSGAGGRAEPPAASVHSCVCVRRTLRDARESGRGVCVYRQTRIYLYISLSAYIYSQTHTYIHTETYFYAFICSCTFLRALPSAAIRVILLLEASSQHQALDFIWLWVAFPSTGMPQPCLLSPPRAGDVPFALSFAITRAQQPLSNPGANPCAAVWC